MVVSEKKGEVEVLRSTFLAEGGAFFLLDVEVKESIMFSVEVWMVREGGWFSALVMVESTSGFSEFCSTSESSSCEERSDDVS